MKRALASAVLVTAGLLSGAAVYAQQSDDVDRSQPKAYVKDSVITTKIKSKLAADHVASLGRIHVDTDANGVVYLSGTADSQAAVERAMDIARNTDGVRGVKNHLTVKAGD